MLRRARARLDQLLHRSDHHEEEIRLLASRPRGMVAWHSSHQLLSPVVRERRKTASAALPAGETAEAWH